MKRITPSFVSPVKPEETVTGAMDDVIRDTFYEDENRREVACAMGISRHQSVRGS